MKTRAPLSPSSVTNPQLLSRRKSGDGGTVVSALTTETDATVDDTTIGYTVDGALEVKDAGVTDAKLGTRTIDDTLATPADTGTLTSLLSWLAGRIKAILGGALGWKDDPPITLTQTLAHTLVEGGPATLGHIYIDPSDGQLTFFDGSVLSGSRADTTQPDAVITVPWQSGDAKPAIYGGGSNASNDQTGVAGESYSGDGVTGATATGHGVTGTATGATSVAVYGEGTHATSGGGQFRNTSGASTALATSLGAAADTGYSAQFSGMVSVPATEVRNTNATLTTHDSEIHAYTDTAALTLTLPAIADCLTGTQFWIIDAGRNSGAVGRAITLTRASTDTFNGGATSKTLATSGAAWCVRLLRNTAPASVWQVNGPFPIV